MDQGDNVYHIFPVFTPHRDALQQHLQDRGIGTLIHYPVPPHQQACYRAYNHLSFPVTEQLAREELSLPLNPTMTDEEVMYVVQAINEFNPNLNPNLNLNLK
jgi:dTDP-4-amino-4,6-dideoxygalactose transaminase